MERTARHSLWLFLVVLSLLFAGCSNTNEVIRNEQNAFTERYKDLKDFNVQNENGPTNIAGEVKITTVNGARLLSVDVTLDQPKKVMKNALVLMVFDDSLNDYVTVDFPYITNYPYQGTSIYPNKDPKGFSVGRAMLLKSSLTDKEKFQNVFKKVKFLVAYQNEKGELQREYFRSSNFVIDPKTLEEIK